MQKEIKMHKMEDFQEKVIIKSKVQKEIEEAQYMAEKIKAKKAIEVMIRKESDRDIHKKEIKLNDRAIKEL